MASAKFLAQQQMEIKPELIFIGILILVPAQWLLSPSETGHLKYRMNRFDFRGNSGGRSIFQEKN